MSVQVRQLSSWEGRRQVDFEAYRRVNELTEASEKLPLAMRNSFEYQLGTDGELYFDDQPLEPFFKRGIQAADNLAADNPDFVVEQVRRHLEYDEFLFARQLAAGDGPDVMLTISPIPDAVVAGHVQLDAYDRDRLKTLVRITEKTTSGARITSISLDRSDRDGLAALAAKFGMTIEADDSSEDILFKRGLAYRQQLELDTTDIPRAIRQVYDQTLAAKLGGDWFGGRPASQTKESLQFIEAQLDLIEEHLSVLDRLDLNDKAARRQARYDFAAALDRRLRGEADRASLRQAGEAAQAAGRNYNGDCPTEVTAALGALGYGNKKQVTISKHCPICGAADVITTIEGEVISGSCGCRKEICTGKVSRRGRASQGLPVANWQTFDRPRPVIKLNPIKQRFGEYAVVRTQLGIGGADKLVIDKRTDQVIAKL